MAKNSCQFVKFVSNKNRLIMLGEGMPWHIILVFFAIGVFSGINGGKKEKKRNEDAHS